MWISLGFWKPFQNGVIADRVGQAGRVGGAKPARGRRARSGDLMRRTSIGDAIALLVFEMAPAEPTEPPRVKPLTSLPGLEGQPCFSPDGKQVAFVWSGETGDNLDIYVKRIGEDSLIRLTTDPAPDQSPAWSSDGRAIAFVRGDKRSPGRVVRQCSAAGGGERAAGRIWGAPGPSVRRPPRSPDSGLVS